jgi:S-formylglutathione hydrolase FrmB
MIRRLLLGVLGMTAGNHSWPVWRRDLGQFIPRLFVDAK